MELAHYVHGFHGFPAAEATPHAAESPACLATAGGAPHAGVLRAEVRGTISNRPNSMPHFPGFSLRVGMHHRCQNAGSPSWVEVYIKEETEVLELLLHAHFRMFGDGHSDWQRLGFPTKCSGTGKPVVFSE